MLAVDFLLIHTLIPLTEKDLEEKKLVTKKVREHVSTSHKVYLLQKLRVRKVDRMMLCDKILFYTNHFA